MTLWRRERNRAVRSGRSPRRAQTQAAGVCGAAGRVGGAEQTGVTEDADGRRGITPRRPDATQDRERVMEFMFF